MTTPIASYAADDICETGDEAALEAMALELEAAKDDRDEAIEDLNRKHRL